jgi:hypothetical protein
MRLRSALAGAALLLAGGASSASATMLISEDRGGQIGHYLQAFATLRSSGERVVIDGNCLSACTLVLGLVPRERICATPRARLGFHAAWMPDTDGRPVTSPMGTQALWNIYPTKVRHWISRNGGLSRRMIFLQGHELTSIVASCGNAREATGSTRRSYRQASPQTIRYERASAAGRRY